MMNFKKMGLIGATVAGMAGSPTMAQTTQNLAKTGTKTIMIDTATCQHHVDKMYDGLTKLGKMPTHQDVVQYKNCLDSSKVLKKDVTKLAKGGENSRYYTIKPDGSRQPYVEISQYEGGGSSVKAGSDKNSCVMSFPINGEGESAKMVRVDRDLRRDFYKDLNRDGIADNK